MNLKEEYKSKIAPALKEKFGYKSIMQAPRLEKIVINMGISDIRENSKALENAMRDLETITGQRPIVTKAKKGMWWWKKTCEQKVSVTVNPSSDVEAQGMSYIIIDPSNITNLYYV